MKISEMITDRYKLRIPPTVYYDLLADVQEVEEEQEPTTKNDLGVDCISRKAVLGLPRKTLRNYFGEVTAEVIDVKDIMRLSSVTPQPRKGHWIVAKGGSYLGMRNGCCSNCKDFYTNDWNVMNYCPNCGAKMVEPQESEG